MGDAADYYYDCEMDAAFQRRDEIHGWLESPDEELIKYIKDSGFYRSKYTDLVKSICEAKLPLSKKQIWSHATFDFVALTETYKRLNIKPSFGYRTARDIRTLIDLLDIDVKATPREGVHHDGLSDAIHQVKYCMLAFKKLEEVKAFEKDINLINNFLVETNEVIYNGGISPEYTVDVIQTSFKKLYKDLEHNVKN